MMSEAMQGSPVFLSGMRAARAERTTTSCGECRRRKQKVRCVLLCYLVCSSILGAGTISLFLTPKARTGTLDHNLWQSWLFGLAAVWDSISLLVLDQNSVTEVNHAATVRGGFPHPPASTEPGELCSRSRHPLPFAIKSHPLLVIV